MLSSEGPVVVVGDGVTDMEAAPPADASIGFGRWAKRAEVMRRADWFVNGAEELIDALRK